MNTTIKGGIANKRKTKRQSQRQKISWIVYINDEEEVDLKRRAKSIPAKEADAIKHTIPTEIRNLTRNTKKKKKAVDCDQISCREVYVVIFATDHLNNAIIAF